MNLEGKLVLVTGGTGAIGGRLVERLVLEQRARVRVLVRSFKHASRLARFHLEMIPGDLTDKQSVRNAVQGCEFVFHCAYDFAGDKEAQRKAGINGTRHICEAVLEHGVSRLVYTSSFSVYGLTGDGDLTESSPWQGGHTLYRKVKRDAERLVQQLHRKRQLPVVTVQPTLVYGPFSAWTTSPVTELKTGLVPLVNGGAGYCNAVYIDDVTDALILAALRTGVTGETFLISASEPVTWKEFYGAYEDMLGIRATADASEEELLVSMKERRKQSGGFAQFVSLLRQPEVKDRLLGLPGMRGPLRILKKCLGQTSWDSLKAATVGDDSASSASSPPTGRELCVPNETMLALYRSKTRVRIDKARNLLGYAPKFDFDRGMVMAAHFVHWANLA